MKTRRTRAAVAATALVAAVSMAAPAPASASSCNMGKLNETCMKIENLVCYLTHRCI